MAMNPALALGKAALPSVLSAGGLLSLGLGRLADGMRAGTEAKAFCAEVDVFVAKADQALCYARAKVRNHVELSLVIEGLCRQANILMDIMENADGKTDPGNRKKQLAHLVETLEKLNTHLRSTGNEIASMNLQLSAPGERLR
jgi:hypothetical protein